MDAAAKILPCTMLNYDRIISQAECYGHSVERELVFLTVHSMLHLFGYDHIEEKIFSTSYAIFIVIPYPSHFS